MPPETIAILRKNVVLDPRAEEPLWRQIVRGVEGLIVEGVLSAGARMPSERDLAAALGVSRITAQTSYNDLRRRELILTRKGRGGSHVGGANPHVSSSMMRRLHGFTEEMGKLGRKVSSRIVESGVVQDRQITTILGLPSGASVLKVHRIRFADGTPMSNELAWYNLQEAPFLAGADLTQSIYGLLAEKGLALTHCEQTIEAVMARQEDDAIFGFGAPMPCVLIKRRSFNAKNAMLEYVEGTFRGDAYSYRMTLRV